MFLRFVFILCCYCLGLVPQQINFDRLESRESSRGSTIANGTVLANTVPFAIVEPQGFHAAPTYQNLSVGVLKAAHRGIDPHALLFPSYRYQLSICAISQNDAPYLKEWIDFHKCVGVEHFYLFNHGSQDHMDEVLKPYVDRGEVELFHWPVIPKQIAVLSQVDAYNWTLRYATGDTKWLAFIDTDEFLFPVEEDTLIDVLKDYENFGGVTVNWQMYGTSKVKQIQKGEFLIEKLVWKAEPHYEENSAIKSIVRPEWTRINDYVHACYYVEGKWAVDENYKPVPTGNNYDYPISKLRINHYFLRDQHFAYGLKLKRLLSRSDAHYEDIKARIDRFDAVSNIVCDPIIHRFLPALRKSQEKMKKN